MALLRVFFFCGFFFDLPLLHSHLFALTSSSLPLSFSNILKRGFALFVNHTEHRVRVSMISGSVVYERRLLLLFSGKHKFEKVIHSTLLTTLSLLLSSSLSTCLSCAHRVCWIGSASQFPDAQRLSSASQ